MRAPFETAHENAIEAAELFQNGWTAEMFLIYCSLVSQLRAAVILEDTDQKAAQSDAELKLATLLEWLSSVFAEEIVPEYNVLYVIRQRVRYLYHVDYSDVGDLPYLYRSEADFRAEIERQIYIILRKQPLEAIVHSPYCSSKSHALSLHSQRLNERNRLLDSIEKDMPTSGGETALYDWARRKAACLQEIEGIDDQLQSIQWRIEEFENGGEFCVSKNTLYVYQGFIKCLRDKHNVTSVTAKIFGKDRTAIYLNVNYCKDCKQFFISYSEYIHYRSIYGILIARIILISNGEYTNNVDYLAQESPLKLCGYSVAQSAGLSSSTRQKLLEDSVDKIGRT